MFSQIENHNEKSMNEKLARIQNNLFKSKYKMIGTGNESLQVLFFFK